MNNFIEYTKKLILIIRNGCKKIFEWKINESLVVAIFVWCVLQIYQQHVEFNKKQTDTMFEDYRELLGVASEMVIEMYPPHLIKPENVDILDKPAIYRLAKQFDTLYWGKSDIVLKEESRPCLKNLRFTLLESMDGGNMLPDSVDNDNGNALRHKIHLIAQALRKDYEKNTASWPFFIDFPGDSIDSLPGCKG